MYTLNVKIMDDCPNRDMVKEYYEKKIATIGYEGDCGVDLVVPMTQEIGTSDVTKIGLGIQCALYKSYTKSKDKVCISKPYMLVPRSSISSTPLSMANSIGIIDPGYRGQIIAAVRNHTPNTYNTFTVAEGTRLFQIVAFDGKPIKVKLVDELSTTLRGEGGFGSTNQ